MTSQRLLAIAKVTQVAGLDGDVRVRPLSRYFEKYVTDKPLFLGETEQISHETKLVKKIGLGKKIRFRFEGIDTRDEAEALIGQYIFASVNDADEINRISSELIHASVYTEDGFWVGELTDILWLPANDVYVIQSDSREILIPVIEEIVKDFDVEQGMIIIHPMDGLLE